MLEMIKRTITPVTGAVAAALLFALASPPFGYSAAAWLVPGLLLVSVRGLPLREAFAAGVVFGAGACALVGGRTSVANGVVLGGFDAAPPLVGGLLVMLAFAASTGLATAAYSHATRRVRLYDLPIAGTFFWLAAEWLHAQIFGWQLLGHTQYRELWLIQIADIGGVHAVSFVIAFASIAFIEASRALATRQVRVSAALRMQVVPLAAILVAVVHGDLSIAQYGSSASEAPMTSALTARPVSTAPMPAFSGYAQQSRPRLQVRRVSTIAESGMRVTPLLCGDLLDTGLVHDLVREGADVLINNCRVSWLESEPSAEQHLALAVFRSVEARRFLVRSTNQGGGDLITALGETYKERPAGQSMSISSKTTHYMRWGDHWIFLGLGMSLIVVGRGRRDE